MRSKEALEFLTENWGQCYQCSKYNECHPLHLLQLEEHETICDYAIYTIKQDLDRLETFDYIAEQNVELREENAKLKNTIEKIKALPNCDICDENWHKGCMCLKRKIEEVLEDDKTED